jgi:hypothetical protein
MTAEELENPNFLFSQEWLHQRSPREEFFWKLRLMSRERISVKLRELMFGEDT